MTKIRLFTAAALLGAASAVAIACGDDDNNTVRERPDGGSLDASSADGADAATACGISLPTTYESAAYETNAAQELALRAAFSSFLSPMSRIEAGYADGGTPDGGVTLEQLAGLYAADAGGVSVRSVTTTYYQGQVDALLGDFVASWNGGAPAAFAPVDPPPSIGGTLSNNAGTSVWMFNGRAVDIRQKIEKGLYNAAFFNHAASLVAPGKPITEATIDRLVAAFGAHPSFPNSQNAPQNKDVYAAGYAARRDSNDPAKPGPYQRAQAGLIKAKASVAAGAKCDADRDAGLAAFFLEWEKSQFATVVFYAGDEQKKLAAQTQDVGAILHAHGEVLGFISGFRTIDPTRRKITDAELESLLQKAFAPDGAPAQVYKLVTDSVAATTNLTAIIEEVKGIYGFTDAEMKDFQTNFP